MTALAWEKNPSHLSRRARTVDRIRRGDLPAPFKAKLYIGPGTRVVCAGCDELILPAEREIELDHDNQRVLRFHAECHDAWSRWSPDASPPS
jgi:hypothetical protein